MRKDILFAGLAMGWTPGYARSFAKYLKEIGYLARAIDLDGPSGSSIVAYSHRSFKMGEAVMAASHILDGQKNKGSTSW